MSNRITVKNVRLSYEHIFTPTAFDDNSEPKYSATLIIAKDHPQLAELKKRFTEAGRETFGSAFKTAGGWPTGYTCALRDADVERNNDGVLLSEANPEYKGCYIINANSSKRPVVLNRDKSAITEDDEIIYSGCYINASIGIAGYTYGKVKKGVKAYLNGVQFKADGERFAADAADDFDVEEDDDDFMS